jgi:prepilin-type N-terminal cleavage/methylation domain-containing protein
MKNRATPSRRLSYRQGMTLIELTVVILVLLSLITILFIGAQAWKRGSNRALCLTQIRQVQVAVRSYANLNNRRTGEDVSPVDLEAELIGTEEWIPRAPVCPGGGNYTVGGSVIPLLGELYMTCSLAVTDEHVPAQYAGW